jgi:4-amino-4-deoxy-L-arabinose transferase-like glycosyltransferase
MNDRPCHGVPFTAAVVLGVLLRALALPLPGTGDVTTWKIWSYGAITNSVSTLYGVGGSPPERRVISLAGAETTVDYPPLALYELGLAGRAYRWANSGRYPNTLALLVTVKATAVLADVGLALLLYLSVRRLIGEAPARWAMTLYLLNPAVILDAAALGYLDPLFVLPAVGALVAAALGASAVAGGLACAAVLTKPQAVVIIPAIALAVWNLEPRVARWRRLAAAGAGACVVAAGLLGPVIAAGSWANMMQTMERLTHHDMLSGNACNLWWIVGYVLRAYHSMGGMGAWAAFTTPTRILQISRVVDIGYPNPRPIGAALALLVMGWSLWTARRARDAWLLAALAAFLVHAYSTLSAQVHENHLYAAVPFLAMASAGRPRLAPVYLALSAIVALNLNLFYGITGDLGYAIPRTLLVIDLTVILSVLNCVALAWHAAVLRRECVPALSETALVVTENRAPRPAVSARR